MVQDLNDPTNRDSIPAMLTPGEFVVNKEATQMYGKEIEKMNNDGLKQRAVENKAVTANKGMKILQGYADGGLIGYNTGGLITFLKDKEGYKDKAYKDSAGVWTIGYGRTGKDVVKGLTTNRKAENTWLDSRAQEELDAIDTYATKYNYDWSDGQKNALASFRYNGGQGMLDMLTDDGTRDNDTIKSKFGQYNKVTNPKTGEKEFVQGLQNRRDAELGLWGGTTPTETPAATPETQQVAAAAPAAEQAAPVQPMPEQTTAEAVPEMMEEPPVEEEGGFLSGLGDTIGGWFGRGGQDVQAPALAGKGPAAEYIPSVTEGSNPQDRNDFGYTLPSSAINQTYNTGGGVKQFAHYANGGQVQYLRGGGVAGKIKAFNPETNKMEYVDKDSQLGIKADMTKKAAVQRLNNKQKPMQFADAAISAQQSVPEMPTAPPQMGPDGMVMPGIEPELPRFQQEGGALAGNIGLMLASQQQDDNKPTVPHVDSAPPVPSSDEAILQNSSQAVESAEDEGAAAEQQTDMAMRQLFDQKYGEGTFDAIESGEMEPTEEQLNFEDKNFQLLQELNRTRASGSMLAPDAVDAQNFNAQKEQSIIAALSEAPVAPGYEGGSVPGVATPGSNPDAPAQMQRPDGGLGYAPAGALPPDMPNIETNAPTPKGPEITQDVPSMMEAPPEMTDSPVFAETTPSAGMSMGQPGSMPVAQDMYESPLVDRSAPEIPAAVAAQAQTAAAEEVEVHGEDKESNPVDQNKVVKDAIAKNGEDPSPELAARDSDDVVAEGQALVDKNPSVMKQAESTIKQAFGDLFDGKELVRMGLMFAGALATGASPGQALAFAGQNYINRIDAKANMKAKRIDSLVKGAKYTTGSIKAYSDSDDPSDLITVDTAASFKQLGNQKEFYGPKGNRILAQEVEDGAGNKFWLDKSGKPVNLSVAHQDASRAPGTPQYRKRVSDSTKTLSNTFKELQDRFGKFSTDAGDAYTTDLTPGKVGHNAAKWAIENDIPPADMGQLLDNAYSQARQESQGGTRAKSITAYLNDQYIQTQVGDPSLFQMPDGKTAPADKVNSLMKRISSNAGLQGSDIANSTKIMQRARPLWTALDEEVRKRWNKQAEPGGLTGFMAWLENELASGVS